MGSLIINLPWGHGAVSGVDTNVYGAYVLRCWPGHWMGKLNWWEYNCRINGVWESRLKSAYQSRAGGVSAII